MVVVAGVLKSNPRMVVVVVVAVAGVLKLNPRMVEEVLGVEALAVGAEVGVAWQNQPVYLVVVAAVSEVVAEVGVLGLVTTMSISLVLMEEAEGEI